MNLLTDDWIPVQEKGEFKYISLKQLLCEERGWQLSCSRDDMELATLQLAVCLVQVVFIPEDEDALLDSYYAPMDESEYDKRITNYMDWFDLLHPDTPFMQKVDIEAQSNSKNWASLQKLFIGLPEISSTSASSNAFLNRVDEVRACSLADAAVAVFQQATNGFSLGGSAFSVGLKGSMPLTTLIRSASLRKSVWSNILNKEWLDKKTQLLKDDDFPTWVVLPKKNEHAHNIGLLRGLFWQPAKIKLVVDKNKKVTGFLKESGLTKTKCFWLHPHTPFNLALLNSNDREKNPFLSAKRDIPLWGQMMSFFYLHKDFSPSDSEGCSRALVVQQYQDIWRKEGVSIAVGGYVKGESAERLAGRKHEFYSLSEGWKNQVAEINTIVSIGLEAQCRLDHAVNEFGNIAIEKNKKGRKDLKFKANLKKKAKHEYFNNSEQIMHSVFRDLKIEHLKEYKSIFVRLAERVFEKLISPYEHETKMQEAIIKSRQQLNKELKDI